MLRTAVARLVMVMALTVPGVAPAQFDSASFNSVDRPLRVLGISPAGDDVPAGRQIVVNFDQPVVPVGRMERRAEEVPVRVRPAANCHWRWANTSSLICELDEADSLRPATRYAVEVERGFAAFSGNRLEKSVSHHFITERPKVTYFRFEAWRGPGSPVIRLNFNLPVSAEMLQQHLVLEDSASYYELEVEEDPLVKSARERLAGHDGDEMPVDEVEAEVERDAVVHSSDQSVVFGWNPPAQAELAARHQLSWLVRPRSELPLDQSFLLRVVPGLESSSGGEKGIENRIVVGFDTFPAFRFLGIRCSNLARQGLRVAAEDPSAAGRCDPQSEIELRFSAPVGKESLARNLQFSPPLHKAADDQPDPWANVYVYTSLYWPHQRGQEYSVPLPTGLRPYSEYTLQMAGSDLKDVFARPLGGDLKASFATDHRRPELSFVGPVSVLEKNVETHAPMLVTNLEGIDIRYDMLTAAGIKRGLETALPVATAEDVSYYRPFRTRDLLGGRSGAVQGTWRSTPPSDTQYYLGMQNWFFSQVTPFHVHAKIGHYNSLVWVTGLDDGRPVGQARVVLYKDRFGGFDAEAPPLAAGITDAQGLVVLEGIEDLDPEVLNFRYYGDDREYFFLRVEKGDDIAIVPLMGEFQLRAEGVNRTYIPNYVRKRYGHIRAWGFTAQGVYRAGDMIQYKLYVRNQDNTRFVSPPSESYALDIMDPTGKVVYSQKDIVLSDFGATDGEFQLPESAAVGWYQFNLSASFSKETWRPLQVLVADFTPAPFRVTTDVNGALFRPGDALEATTLARLHAGGPYADAAARITATVTPNELRSDDPRVKGYYFDVSAYAGRTETLHRSDAQIDGQGQLATSFQVPAAEIVYGTLAVESAVRDDRGKFIASRASAKYVGRDRYVGLRQGDWLLESGKTATATAMVVDEYGAVVAETPVRFNVEYRETVAARVQGAGSAFLTQYTHQWTSLQQCESVSTFEGVSCEFVPVRPGYYRITAHVTDSQGRTHQTDLQRWAIGPGEVLWESDPGYSLALIPEKEEYRVGETARFLVQNPYPGAQALVTVERFGVQKQWLTSLAGSAEVIEVPVERDAVPGFYVSVVVMSPRIEQPPGDGQVDLGKPAFRMGYARVEVRDSAKALQVQIETDAAVYKPGQEVTVDLHTLGPDGAVPVTELAIAVLDEAVFDLLADGRRAYDPYGGFYVLEPLDLYNFNLLTRLVGQRKFEEKGASAGGDGGSSEFRSVFKYVSYWNPSVRPDAQGHAQIKFHAPDNLTGWRVLAVAMSAEDLMGLGEGQFKVNRPTEIRPALPNQVVEGDRFEARFTVMNRTDTARTLSVEVVASGALQDASGTASGTMQVQADPYKRYTMSLPVRAGASGEINFSVRAVDSEDRDALRVALPVRPRLSMLTAATYGTTTAERVTEKVLIPEQIRTGVGALSVTASPSIIGGLEGAFEYLRDYPYICWEQKLTKGVMASHFNQLRAYLPPALSWSDSGELPQHTLNLAADHQAPNGGMAYYVARDEYVDPYLSAYTALAFGWLRDAGWQVPEAVESKLHRYLLELLRRDVVPDFYSRGMSASVRAVALAALARQGKVELADLQRYERHVPDMSLFGKAHFLMALDSVPQAHSMRETVLEAVLSQGNYSGGKVEFSETLDFAYQRILHSSLRSNCAVLSAMLGSDDPGRLADLPYKLVSTITQGRKQRDRWENTQENMFCMSALIDYSRLYERERPNMSVAVSAGGEAMGAVSFEGFRDSPQVLQRPLAAEDSGKQIDVDLARRGDGRLYYATRLDYSLLAPPTEPVNAGIELQREYSVERDAGWVLLEEPMAIRVGDLVRVDLYVRLAAARNFVVVDDPVPGGLEPVNRDLATSSMVDAAKGEFERAGGSFWYRYGDWREFGSNLWSFYHRELRHDSARFYSEYLPAGNYHLSYVAQAIAPGEFASMPGHAEEMYNPDTFGKSRPSVLRVMAQ